MNTRPRASDPVKHLCALASPLFVLTAQGQTVSVTPSSTTLASAGGTLTFTVNLTYPTTQAALGLSIAGVPSNWTYVSTNGANIPAFVPSAGVTGNFAFLYTPIPAASASFTFAV